MRLLQEPLKSSVNPLVAARNIRAVLDLNNNWASSFRTWEDALKHLKNIIEKTGIFVVTSGIVGNNTRRSLSVEEFRGFALVDAYAPFLFVNGKDFKSAQMFTLAHELAHVWLGSSAAFDLRNMQPAADEIELACDRIAAEFLLPEAELMKHREIFKKYSDPYQFIAREFKVSQIVVARRALDNGLITRDKFFNFYRKYIGKKKKIENSGGDSIRNMKNRIGESFGNLVNRAVIEGKLLHKEAYRLTGVYGETYLNRLLRKKDSDKTIRDNT